MNNEQRVAIGPLIPMNRRDVTPVGTGRRATVEEYREGACHMTTIRADRKRLPYRTGAGAAIRFPLCC
jgi:hypothetical protein